MNNIEELICQSRIKEISRGSSPLIGEKERLALTAMYWHQEHQAAVEAFQKAGRNLLLAQEQIVDLIAQLEAKNIRADACVNAFEGIETERFAGKSIGEFLAGEVKLNKAEPKPDGSFGFTFSGLAIQVMAESFADQFKSSGAVNYLELLFEHSEIGPLTVTMQRVDGLTPAQKLAAAEAALSAANEKLSKPVVLSSSTVMSRAYVVRTIKAAGFTVEGNADAE